MNQTLSGQPGALQRDWALSHVDDLRTMSGFHSGLGFLSLADARGKQLSLEPAEIDLLRSYLSPATRFAPEAVTYSGTTVISASGDDAVIALGRALRAGANLPADVVEQLANVTQARHDLMGRAELVNGLAALWYGALDPSNVAEAIVGRISLSTDRAQRRALEAEAAGNFVGAAPAVERQAIVENLLQRWNDETEPQVREALAGVIARSTSVGWDVQLRPFPFE